MVYVYSVDTFVWFISYLIRIRGLYDPKRPYPIGESLEVLSKGGIETNIRSPD